MISTEEKKETIYTVLLDNDNEESELNNYSTGKLVHLIQTICKSYVGKFTVRKEESGYIYENGTMRRNDCFVLNFFDTGEDTINNIAADLCAFFKCKDVCVNRREEYRHIVKDSI